MKNYFLIIDTETTKTDLVVDFGAVVVDKRGNVVASCAALVSGIYQDKENNPLFYDATSIFSEETLGKRYAKYDAMIKNGARRLATVEAINRWLLKVKATFNPILTAYNLAFDLGKCANTNIDLSIFNKSFCLWQAAVAQFGFTRNYRAFVVATHSFNAPTKFGNMTYKTNAEVMARFVLGNPELEDEPHTAYEDALLYELPILKAILSKRSVKWVMENSKPYNWKETQVKDWFKAV